MLLGKPDKISFIADGTTDRTEVTLSCSKNRTDVNIRSYDNISFVILTWKIVSSKEDVKVLGDAWERSYADLEWKVPDYSRVMPWYFAVSNGSDSNTEYKGRFTECAGVMVQPNAMCSWQYSRDTVTLNLDIRNGGMPINLNGRTLKAATIVTGEYSDVSAFSALKSFCRELSPSPLAYDKIIYGSNNWYYAYGKSSREEIISDTKLVAGLCVNSKQKPFMVIDDGWQPIPTNPPWVGSEKFGDMKTLADEMRNAGVIPGIWVRYLNDEEFKLDLPDEARRGRNKMYLDPTHPAVKEHIRKTTEDIVSWGYKLIKHDYSTFDITGLWGKDMDMRVTPDGEGFCNRTKTTAEIIKEFYAEILKYAGDAAVLGCNTVSHFCAGLAHANRIGDDTSGREWKRTLEMGVNTLAFRLCQNGSFYICDADCVGIMGPIDWKYNSQWLDLVANSGTSLFVSCKPSEAHGDVKNDLTEEFVPASVQSDELIPLDWMETKTPSRYLINGELREYKWN